MNITIIGSGNIAHALISSLKVDQNTKLYMLSSVEKNWQSITAIQNDKNKKGYIELVSNDASQVIPKSDIIIFTLPSFAREQVLIQIAPYVADNTLMGAFPGTSGFDEEVKKTILNDTVNIFSAQRVPYIARVVTRGESVNVTKKESIYVAIEKEKNKVQVLLETILDMKVNLLDDFLEVNLSNSNPILHSARMYSLIKDKLRYKDFILFYEKWDDKASTILLQMDEEFMKIIQALNLKNVKSLKEHYGVETVEEMTKKIQSIGAFKGILMPMIKIDNELLPDVNSRYFTEDIGMGLKYIKDYALNVNVETPVIDKVYNALYTLMES